MALSMILSMNFWIVDRSWSPLRTNTCAPSQDSSLFSAAKASRTETIAKLLDHECVTFNAGQTVTRKLILAALKGPEVNYPYLSETY